MGLAYAQGWWLYAGLLAVMVFVFGAIPFTDAMIARYVDDSMRSRVAGIRLAVSLGISSLAVWLLGPVVKGVGFDTCCSCWPASRSAPRPRCCGFRPRSRRRRSRRPDVAPFSYFGRIASAVPWMNAFSFSTSSAPSLPVKPGMPLFVNGPLKTKLPRLLMTSGDE